MENKFGNEFIYSGPFHTLDKTEKAIVDSGLLLLIGASAAKRSLDNENDLKIDVAIQNLKNEAISKASQDFYQTDSDSSLDPDSDSE